MVDLLSIPSSQVSPVLLRSTPDFGLALQVSAYERGNEADTEITPRVSETRILPAQLAMINAEPVDFQALCSKLGHRTRRSDKLKRTASTAGVAWSKLDRFSLFSLTDRFSQLLTALEELHLRTSARFASSAVSHRSLTLTIVFHRDLLHLITNWSEASNSTRLAMPMTSARQTSKLRPPGEAEVEKPSEFL